jgi:hypothetical protein
VPTATGSDAGNDSAEASSTFDATP